MATTTHGLHYPLVGDPPNGASQIQQLATDVDAALTWTKSIISTNETIPTGAYAVATTPDRASSIVVPASGMIRVRFSALVKAAASGATAALFIGSNQLVTMADASSPAVQEVSIPASGTPSYGWIYTTGDGFVATNAVNGDASSVTTGMIRGSDFLVDVAAGTYTVEVRYRATGLSGTIDVKDRKLYVRAEW